MQIVETPIFTRRIGKVMSEEEYRHLQVALRDNPELGTQVGGKLRKVRWGSTGRGKRGGARVIYYWAQANGVVLMLFAFAKNEQEDLTPEQTRVLRALVEAEYP
ncbi:MAG TPA: type II toxin-antitoxin system RelE/ParE family toxin [Longimicrobiaceae bacterium]|nr:type II toxin-antitoxin system RelE/ParE family toxin [Longimicrobiaceae bacterium]